MRHRTRPHPVTWAIWSLLSGSAALVQWIGGGGFAALVLAFTALMNVVTLILALRQAKFYMTRFDIVIIMLAILSLVMWRVVGNPNLAAVLLTLTAVLGYIPTFRKSISQPGHETVSLYFLSGFKQLIGIIALSAYNVATLLFPVVVVAANFGLVVLLVLRRKLIAREG